MSSNSSELSAAERYRKSKSSASYPQLKSFEAQLAFPLDDFQEQACKALEDGAGVLVAAPTGAGKTVVGEFAIHLAIQSGQKVFYTTPIKALSNQKFAELVKRYGKERVGLLTGDNNQNSEAQIVVMTTEVLRNMIYATSETLKELGYVVMDEVHYLADRFRGAVWEEVILHLPKDVLQLCGEVREVQVAPYLRVQSELHRQWCAPCADQCAFRDFQEKLHQQIYRFGFLVDHF